MKIILAWHTIGLLFINQEQSVFYCFLISGPFSNQVKNKWLEHNETVSGVRLENIII